MDVLNIIACFSVIILHCTEKYFKPDKSAEWGFALSLQSICICAVPIFFMLSGAMLLEYRKRYTTRMFFKKRLGRIFFPFLIWSAIYAVWRMETGQLKIMSFLQLVDFFLQNKILSIFWFFYTLIPIYFCIPILSLVIKKENRKIIWYFTGLGIFNMSVIPFFRDILDLNFGKFSFPIAESSICYFTLGWLLKNEEMSKKIRGIIYAAGIVCVPLIYYFTVHFTGNAKETNRILITSASLPVVIMASAVFLFVKNLDFTWCEKSVFQHLVRNLASASFGVYLVHNIVIFYVKKLSFVNPFSPWYSTMGALVIYFLSVLVVLVIKKIPFLKKIVP